MKKLFLSALFVSCALLGFAQVVTLYRDCNFRGMSRTLKPGRYSLDNIGFGAYQLSSIRVPSGLKVILYDGREPGTGGRKITVNNDVSCMDGDWNDKTGSIVVDYDNSGGGNYNNNNGGYNNNNAYNPPVRPAYGGGADVVLFENCGLQGPNRAVTPGRHNLKDFGIRNDAISSMRIPSGYRVTLYNNENYNGSSRTYYANVYCLEGDMNDQASSIEVVAPGGSSYNNNNNNGNYNNDYGNRYNNNDNYDNSYAGLTAYTDSYFRGNHAVYNPGRHNLVNASVKNNISSLNIQRGFRVIVFDGYGFTGRSQVFTSSVGNLQLFGWNDNIRSLIVERDY